MREKDARMPSPSSRHSEPAGRSASLAISTEIVQLFRQRFGRGPTKAQTHLDDRYVVCFLRDVQTPEDDALMIQGRADLVKAARDHIRAGANDELIAIVERHTGRRVECALSDHDPERNLTALVFPLFPPAGDVDLPSEGELGR
jgi:uncharacterized protein YbcI